VYRVKAVGAIDTSVMTSTLAKAGSSVPKNASKTAYTGSRIKLNTYGGLSSNSKAAVTHLFEKRKHTYRALQSF